MNTKDTSRAEFEAWCHDDDKYCTATSMSDGVRRSYNEDETAVAWSAWQAARAGSIDSQLDSNTLKKMIFLYESKKSMRPVGVVLIDDDTGKRATIDMGRVTWTDPTTEESSAVQPELAELSDAKIAAMAYDKFGIVADDADIVAFAHYIMPVERSTLSDADQTAFPDRDQSKSAEKQGIFHKFEVHRTDGNDAVGRKHFGCRYFVLDMDHDAFAPAALRAYAAACGSTHPQLASELDAEFGAAVKRDDVAGDAKDAILAAEELAEEARGNGNSWDLWCEPKLNMIRAAIAASAKESP